MNKTITTLAAFALMTMLPFASRAQDEGAGLSEAFSALRSAGGPAAVSAVPAVPAPVPAAAASGAASRQPKDWTLMIYVDGKNSLESAIFKNVNQMEQVGSTDKVNVVVEIGHKDLSDNGEGSWKGCRRFLIVKSTFTKGMASPALQSIPGCDMGDYHQAIDFGKWAMKEFPARHYMYVLWNHGGGWVPTTPGYANAKAIAYDDNTHHVMSTPQMGAIMRALGHIDVYGSDACLMQMAEVAYELKDRTDFVVGSEINEPGSGWDYASMLRQFYSSPMTPLDLAKAVVDTYTPQYSSRATQSAIRASAIDGFARRLDAFADAVEKAGEGKTAAAARDASQDMLSEDTYKDLYDFASRVAASSGNADVKARAADLIGYISGTLVVDNKVTKDLPRMHGVSISIPADAFDPSYTEMLFAGTRWPGLIQFLQK